MGLRTSPVLMDCFRKGPLRNTGRGSILELERNDRDFQGSLSGEKMAQHFEEPLTVGEAGGGAWWHMEVGREVPSV